jgi:hypothetical protein
VGSVIVSDIHTAEDNVGGWLIFIEGCRFAFTDIEALVGTGVGSWIGTAYGDREVLPGLVMPAELHLGETMPWRAQIRDPTPAAFSVIDYDGRVSALFVDWEDDETTDTLARRLSPLDDPAPDPAVGLDQEPITIWDRDVGIEHIGPAGQRRWFWITPTTAPPGPDHFASPGWPSVRVTDTPSLWAGRRVAVYRIVQDPDTETWPSWTDQHDGGSLWWIGTLTDRGEWGHKSDGRRRGRSFTMYALGPSSWLERSINLSRPTTWYQPTTGVTLSGDELLVAAWIEPLEPEPLGGNGLNFAITKYDCHTLKSGDDLSGLVTPTELWSQIRDIAYTVVDGTDHGTVLAANNAQWTGPTASEGIWQTPQPNRRVRISANGQTIEIKCEATAAKLGFRLGLAVDARVAQAAGWDITVPPWTSRAAVGGYAPVGGTLWGENVGDDILPPLHVVARFSTRDEYADPAQPQSQWDNNGAWRVYTAPYQGGTVTLDHEGGTDVYLTIGTVRCEGQHGNPFGLGSTIDGVPCDAAGWWIFRGKRLTAAEFLAGVTEPSDYVAVALCSWVATVDGDAVEVNAEGMATIKIERFEDPRRFGLPFDPLTEPWVNVVGGLECAPLGVVGGIAVGGPGWRHRAIVSALLSTGTSVWDDGGNAVTITVGVNQPPGIPPGETAGDIEVADMGLAIPYEHVDWTTFYTAAAQLPGGVGGALNRVLYVLYGSEKMSTVLRELMAGAGWAWSLKRMASGGMVPAFGAYDPLRLIAPDDVVAVLTREDMAEPSITDAEQWRGAVELRRDGPFDRFVLEVGKEPIDAGGENYTLAMESTDPGRRARSGRIEFPVRDPGLRDPAPWIGTPGQQQYDWTGLARLRFASGFGPKLAKQHRIYRAVYNGRFAGLLGLGSPVQVVDPTAEAPDGTRGINHRGRVIDCSIISGRSGRTSVRVAVELERMSVDQVHVWAPMAYSGRGGWDSGTSMLTIAEDIALVGDGHADTTGFSQPDWSGLGPGALLVTVLQSETGQAFDPALTVTAEIAAVGVNTLTLANLSAPLLRDTVKLVVGQPFDDQTDGSQWPLQRDRQGSEAQVSGLLRCGFEGGNERLGLGGAPWLIHAKWPDDRYTAHHLGMHENHESTVILRENEDAAPASIDHPRITNELQQAPERRRVPQVGQPSDHGRVAALQGAMRAACDERAKPDAIAIQHSGNPAKLWARDEAPRQFEGVVVGHAQYTTR